MNANATILEILKFKGNQVWTISPEATVFQAIQLMAEKNVGARVVMTGDRVVGIISERDYTRKVALVGKSSKETRVHELLSAPIITAKPETSVEECMRLMTRHRVRHLPVLEGDKLLGRGVDWRFGELEDLGPEHGD